MSHSNSSLNCFADCMAKYNYRYVLQIPPSKPPSPHLVFGTMAHEVLYKAGKIRDNYKDGIEMDYEPCIPSEVLYPELKTEFQIKTWRSYFLPIVKQIAKYEEEIGKEMEEPYEIHRELKLQLSTEEVFNHLGWSVEQPFVGIIDFLMISKNKAVILDYKFSAKRKSQSDFDQNSQLPLYAKMIEIIYGIPLRNIKVGYIDIPKQMFDSPVVLTNGTLSRSKSQNCSGDMYEKAVKAIHGDDKYYNCEPGGYYYDCWCNLQLNKSAYLNLQYLDEDCAKNIVDDLGAAAQMIDHWKEKGNFYLRKYSSYSCVGCEYLDYCKPWLTVKGGTKWKL